MLNETGQISFTYARHRLGQDPDLLRSQELFSSLSPSQQEYYRAEAWTYTLLFMKERDAHHLIPDTFKALQEMFNKNLRDQSYEDFLFCIRESLLMGHGFEDDLISVLRVLREIETYTLEKAIVSFYLFVSHARTHRLKAETFSERIRHFCRGIIRHKSNAKELKNFTLLFENLFNRYEWKASKSFELVFLRLLDFFAHNPLPGYIAEKLDIRELCENPYSFLKRLRRLKNTKFCILPFVGVCIEAGGRHKPCCKYKSWQSSPRATEAGLTEVLKSSGFARIRNSFEKHELDEGCSRCWQDERAGVRSLRQSTLQAHGHWFSSEMINSPRPMILDYGFGNLCNAACITCESSSSSLWNKDDEFLEQYEDNLFERSTRPPVFDRFDWNEADFKNLRHVIHAQNEVMLSKQFRPSLKQLVDLDVAGRCEMTLSTNGSYFPPAETIELLLKFSKVHIQISIDGMGSKNDYIRYPLKWTAVTENAAKWAELSWVHSQVKVSMRTTISCYNVIYLKELTDWWERISQGASTSFGYCWYPSYLNPCVFPDSVKQQILAHPGINSHVRKVLQKNLLRPPDSSSADQFRLFQQFTRLMDSRRKLKAESTFPELFALLERAHV